jgi:hypothetical protein
MKATLWIASGFTFYWKLFSLADPSAHAGITTNSLI